MAVRVASPRKASQSAAVAQTQVPATLSSSSPGVTSVGATALRKESSPAVQARPSAASVLEVGRP